MHKATQDGFVPDIFPPSCTKLLDVQSYVKEFCLVLIGIMLKNFKQSLNGQ